MDLCDGCRYVRKIQLCPGSLQLFHQLSRHNPAPRLFGQVRAWMGKKLDAARTEVLALIGLDLDLATDVAEQA